MQRSNSSPKLGLLHGLLLPSADDRKWSTAAGWLAKTKPLLANHAETTNVQPQERRRPTKAGDERVIMSDCVLLVA